MHIILLASGSGSQFHALIEEPKKQLQAEAALASETRSLEGLQ